MEECRDRETATGIPNSACLQKYKNHCAAPANVAAKQGLGLDVEPTSHCHETTAILLCCVARKDASDAHITHAIDDRTSHTRRHCASSLSVHDSILGVGRICGVGDAMRGAAHTLVVQEVQARERG